MHKPYYIPVTSPIGFAAAVLSTSYERPLEPLREIESELRTRGVAGDILIDTLLANGSATHRYFRKKFDGTQFTSEQGEKLEPTPELVRYSREMLRSCPFPLDTSLLLSDSVRSLL